VSESLRQILWAVESDDLPVFDYDCVVRWEPGELARCLAAGLFSPAEPSRFLTCYECGELHDSEVVFFPHVVTGELRAAIACTLGEVLVPLERLQRWQMPIGTFLDVVFAHIERNGPPAEIASGRVWRLGKAKWANSQWNVFFARRLHWSDAWKVFNQAQFPARSVVFTPQHVAELDERIIRRPTMLPLREVLTWGEGPKFVFDHAYVEDHLAELLRSIAAQPVKKKPRKQGPRPAHINAIMSELQQHLRAARDYAITTRDRTGAPALLKPPTKETLAKLVGVHKSTVTHCFRDESAVMLNYLWNLAHDVDRILEYRSTPSCGS
jgi:hypothetical protein